MKIPMIILQGRDAARRKYKYYVDSIATRGKIFRSVEFIAGPSTKGGLIDRCLKLHFNHNDVVPRCE